MIPPDNLYSEKIPEAKSRDNFFQLLQSKHLKGRSEPRVRHVFDSEGRSGPRVRHVFDSELSGPRVRHVFDSELSGPTTQF